MPAFRHLIGTPHRRMPAFRRRIRTPHRRMPAFRRRIRTPHRRMPAFRHRIRTPHRRMPAFRRRKGTPHRRMPVARERAECPACPGIEGRTGELQKGRLRTSDITRVKCDRRTSDSGRHTGGVRPSCALRSPGVQNPGGARVRPVPSGPQWDVVGATGWTGLMTGRVPPTPSRRRSSSPWTRRTHVRR